MTEQAPSPSAPKLPPSLAANPNLSSWIRISRRRTRERLAGKGRDRPGHRDGAGADRRRRTRRRYRPRADGARLDGRQSQRRRHLRQSFGAAFRARDPAGLRRNPPDFSRRRRRPARRRHRCARHRRRRDFRSRQCQHQLLGTRQRSLARPRRDAGRGAEIIGAADARRQFRAAARYSRQGVRPSALHSRFYRCRACCMAACCGRSFRPRRSSN